MNTDSILNFRVKKVPITAQYNGGIPVRDKAALVREDTHEAISVVGRTFGVIQNEDLFPAIDEQVFSSLGDKHRETARVIDRVARGGHTCIREYAFPELPPEYKGGIIRAKGDKVTDLGFKLSVINGFGGASLKVMAGAIDFYCDNGCIFGSMTSGYTKRHTRRVQVIGMGKAVKTALTIFHSQSDKWAGWAQKRITDKQVSDYLEDEKGISTALGKKLFSQWQIEKANRGASVWAFFSAMTHFASHTDGQFATRRTGRDHSAITQLQRSRKVEMLTESVGWQQLAA